MRKLVGLVVGIGVALALAWVVAHVVISPVNPSQEAPSGHYEAPCWACHMVSDSVPVQ